jgi:Zn-dependent protease
MKGTYRIGRLFGIPLGLNLSWFISLGFVIAALGIRVYPDLFPDHETWLHITLAIVSAMLFFASIIFHELAHGLVAKHYSIPVKEITLFVLGGVARIAREAPRPFAEFVMAAAGPMASLVLAAFFFILWFATGTTDGPLGTMLQWLWIMNVILALFNLVPGFPLDGGRVLRAILWGAMGNYQRATRISTFGGHLTAYGLMIIGTVIVLGPDGLVMGLSPFNGLWLVLLGMFLKASAHQSYFQMRVVKVLQDYPVSTNMTWDLPTIADTVTVEDAVRWYGDKRVFLFVTQEGAVIGVVDGRRLRSVPQKARSKTTIGQIMTQAKDAAVIGPEDNMASVLERMELEDVFDLPVVENGRVVGHVGRDSFMQIFARHPDLVR